MKPWLIILITILVIVILLICILLIISFNLHNKLFKHRFIPDPLVINYSKEEFKLSTKPFNAKYQNSSINGNIYYHEAEDYKGLILYLHGMWSSQESYIQDIAYYAKNNYLVLAIDYLGTCISDGKTLKGLGASLLCADIALDYIKKDNSLNKYPLYVIGHSWGGYAAVNSLKLHPEIKKVIGLAGFTSVVQELKCFLPKKLWILIPFVYFVDILRCGKYSTYKSYKWLKNTNGKVLLVHSIDDPMVKYSYNTGLVKNKVRNSNVEYLILDNKGHQPHYSSEAIKKIIEYETTLRSYKGDSEKINEYMKTVNFHELGELDIAVMDKILEFIEK